MNETMCKECEDTEMIICPQCDGAGSVLADINEAEAILPCGKCKGERDIECETCQQ